MNGSARFKQPTSCTAGEHQDFARLVRQAFKGAVDVESRMAHAKWLAFYYPPGDELAAIAAIKAPDESARAALFQKADVPASAFDYQLELGWVCVEASHRGKRIASSLCQSLLERVPTPLVYSTTRTNNTVMMKILRALRFERVGKPYPRRNEELAVFLCS